MFVNLGGTADLICVADANPIISGMFSWKWLVRATDTHTHIRINTTGHCLYHISFIGLPLYYFFSSYCSSLAFVNAPMPYFTGSNYPSTTPLPASHSAQIQKNSFHYCCVTKGHIHQCGVVSVSIDAFCSLTHPLAVEHIPLSTCMAPTFFFFLFPWLPSLWHYPSACSCEHPSLTNSRPSPSCYLSRSPSARQVKSHPTGGGERVLRDGGCLQLISPHSVFRREKRRWRWERRPRKTIQAS